MSHNKNFITFHDVDCKKILKGVVNCVQGRLGYCEDIDYEQFPIVVTCALYKADRLVETLAVYTQKNKSWFVDDKNSDVELNIRYHGEKLKDIYTPDSIPYWFDHPENMRDCDSEKKKMEYCTW